MLWFSVLGKRNNRLRPQWDGKDEDLEGDWSLRDTESGRSGSDSGVLLDKGQKVEVVCVFDVWTDDTVSGL